MNTYIISEQVMNGTVTMMVHVSGIQAHNFIAAKTKLMNILDASETKWKFTRNDDEEFCYCELKSSQQISFYTIGKMKSEPLQLL